MLKKIFAQILIKTVHSIAWAIYIQLAISFVYIPILIYWGLPISYMSVIGNLIFTPFLFLFIFLSFIIFSTEILLIPNTFLCTALNSFCTFWLKILTLGSPQWLIGFAYPGFCILILFALSGIATIWLSRSWRLGYRTLFLGGVLTLGLTILKQLPVTSQLTLACGKNTLNITQSNNKLTLTIPRMTIHEQNFKRWLTRTARPTLYKTFGHAEIYTIILINPTTHEREMIEQRQTELGYQKLVFA